MVIPPFFLTVAWWSLRDADADPGATVDVKTRSHVYRHAIPPKIALMVALEERSGGWPASVLDASSADHECLINPSLQFWNFSHDQSGGLHNTPSSTEPCPNPPRWELGQQQQQGIQSYSLLTWHAVRQDFYKSQFESVFPNQRVLNWCKRCGAFLLGLCNASRVLRNSKWKGRLDVSPLNRKSRWNWNIGERERKKIGRCKCKRPQLRRKDLRSPVRSAGDDAAESIF